MLDGLFREVKRLWLLLVIIVAGIFLFDGAGSMVALSRLAMFALILVAFHMVRKSLFPYIDLQKFTAKAAQQPMSAAVVFATIIAFIVALCFITVSHAVTDAEVISKAKPYMRDFKAAVDAHWPDAPHQEYFPAKVEQETCADLRRCWNPHTELKTSREYGFSLSQMTIAYRPDGSVRFDKFEEAKRRYLELSAWQWEDRYNPRYHFAFIVLEARRLYSAMKPYFHDDVNRWAAAMVSYNAGPGAVLDRRALCAHRAGCDKTAWFGGLSAVRAPGEERLLYGKPLYQRRNEYPHNIINVRSGKYVTLWRAV